MQGTRRKDELRLEQMLRQGALTNEGMQYLSPKCELVTCDLFSLAKQRLREDKTAVYKASGEGFKLWGGRRYV